MTGESAANPKSLIERVFAILDAVARAGDGISLANVAATARLPKPTAYRLVRELAEGGLVRREHGAQGGISAGPRLEQLALALMENSGARAVRQSVLARLVSEIGETCNVTMLDGNQVLYLERVESASPLRVHLQPGSRVPLHCSASGKVFLANLPKARRERLLAQIELAPLTARTIRDRKALEAELQRIRKEGYAVDNEEYVAGLLCVAVPIADSRGRILAAVAVQAPVARLSYERGIATLPALRKAAKELSATYAPRPAAG